MSMSLDPATCTYNGKVQEPKAIIVLDGKELVEGTDFTIDYIDNIDQGIATATVTGINNFSGTNSTTFTIRPKSVTVEWGNTVLEYTGAEQAPEATVKTDVSGEKINLVVTGKETNVGTGYEASIYMTATTVEGGRAKLSNYDLQDTTMPFSIVLAESTELNVTLDNYEFEYNGTAHTPKATVIVNINGEDVTLTSGDEYTVTYANNTNSSTETNKAKVTVTGKGNFNGLEKVIEFTINPAPISKVTITLTPDSFEFDGTSKEPLEKLTYNTMTLIRDTDYDVAYSNNTAVGIGKVILTGKGNYTGQTEVNFRIIDTTIPDAPTIIAKINSYNGDEYISGTVTNKNVLIELTHDEEVSSYEWSTSVDGEFTSKNMFIVDNKARMRFDTEMNQTIYFRTKDNSGNASNLSSITIIIDKTAPSGIIDVQEVIIKNGLKYVNNNTVTIKVTATDNVSDAANLKVAFINEDEFSLSNPNNEIDWLDYEYNKIWTSSPGDGLKTVYVLFKDQAGNQSVYLANGYVTLPDNKITIPFYDEGIVNNLPGDEFYVYYDEGDTWNDVIENNIKNQVTHNGDSSILNLYNSGGYVTLSFQSSGSMLEPIQGVYVKADESIDASYSYQVYKTTGQEYYIIRN